MTTAIQPVTPITYLDDDYIYKPSVKTARYCASCRSNYPDPKNCPGCYGVPGKPHFRGISHRTAQNRNEDRRLTMPHHRSGQKRSFKYGPVIAAD